MKMTVQERKNYLQKLLSIKSIRTADQNTFLKGWKAVAFLYPGIHADEFDNPTGGWPDELKPVAAEAFRRADAGRMADDELYPWRDCKDGVRHFIFHMEHY